MRKWCPLVGVGQIGAWLVGSQQRFVSPGTRPPVAHNSRWSNAPSVPAMQCSATHTKKWWIGGKSQHIEQFNRGAPRNDVKWDPFAYAYRIYEVFNSTIIRKIIHDFLGYDKCRFFFLKKKSYDMCSLLRPWYILFL